jgi:hypothetical protein
MMGFVVGTCDGCGVKFRTSKPDHARMKSCPRCQTPLADAIDRAVAAVPGDVVFEGFADVPAAAVFTANDMLEPASATLESEGTLAFDDGDMRKRTTIQWVSTSALLIAALVAINVWLSSPRSHRTPTAQGVLDSSAQVQPVPAAPRSVAEPPSRDVPPPAPKPAFPADVPPPPQPSRSGMFASRSLPPPPVPPSRPEPAPLVLHERDAPGLRPFMPVAPDRHGQTQRDGSAPPSPLPAPRLEKLPEPETPFLSKSEEPYSLLVRGDDGRPIVTRVYGQHNDQLVVLLPNGELGWVDGRSFTDRPFRPMNHEELRESLQSCDPAHEGPYRGFQVRETTHYVIFYQCSEAFAADSARLLESLYHGLFRIFTEWKMELHEAEFPLVAVIYDSERDFRAHNHVAPDVQAYYHILSNRIFFFEHSERDETSPEVEAIRQPQTIAHEGTHQILLNIGVQPRLARWPIWLVEGLAEYCAPTYTKRGAEWAGVGKVNPLHMATIRDLEDQSTLIKMRGMPTPQLGRTMVEHLATVPRLKPVEYASAWALTHYLASKRPEELQSYLKTMSQMRPLTEPSPSEQLKAFCTAFGADLLKLDKKVHQHLAGLKGDSLPYYAVMFEQPVSTGAVRRGALVSQSPSMIRQLLESLSDPGGLPLSWSVTPFPSRTRAMLSIENWVNPR